MKINYEWQQKLFDNKWYISTVIACFVPIGFILTVICNILEAKYVTKRNKSILYSGIGAIMFSLFMSSCVIWTTFVGDLDKNTYMLALMYIPAFLVSVYLFIIYGVLSKRAKRFAQCILLIQNEHITSIPEIAEITGMTKKETVSVLRKFIKMGGLDGADMDSAENEVVFTKSIWAKQKVSCKNCGASLVVNLGHNLVCSFCNHPLEPYKKAAR